MFDPKQVGLGIAPIAWTNDDMPDLGKENTFEQCVSEMALAGFAGTEIGNKYPRNPLVLKRALDLRGLRVANAWFSSFLITRPYAETEANFIRQCDFLAALGAGNIGVSEQGHSVQGLMDAPIFASKHVMDAAEWRLLADGLNRLGRIAGDKGLNLVYHHHMGTVVQTEAETDRLMENTDPGLVGLLFDSGHFAFSGEDPLAMLEKYVKRVRHVHLKDVRPALVGRVRDERLSFLKAVRLGAFTVPGDGGLDFVPMFKALAAAGYRGWMLVEAEQDPAKANPLEYALKARKYLREAAGI
ncbi:MAG: myo-inosose-2 dehydratase [Planctomycetota bacterium]|jgi:inosose dehydratase|nr:myo-inosose-2 dehydratase [Planctomycetota bacterium]